jgi:hypothetical protein
MIIMISSVISPLVTVVRLPPWTRTPQHQELKEEEAATNAAPKRFRKRWEAERMGRRTKRGLRRRGEERRRSGSSTR